MSTRKGRPMRASEVRTGDIVVPPSASRESVVVKVHKIRDEVVLTYGNHAAEAHMSPNAILRVHRPVVVVSDDSTPSVPEVVFQSSSS